MRAFFGSQRFRADPPMCASFREPCVPSGLFFPTVGRAPILHSIGFAFNAILCGSGLCENTQGRNPTTCGSAFSPQPHEGIAAPRAPYQRCSLCVRIWSPGAWVCIPLHSCCGKQAGVIQLACMVTKQGGPERLHVLGRRRRTWRCICGLRACIPNYADKIVRSSRRLAVETEALAPHSSFKVKNERGEKGGLRGKKKFERRWQLPLVMEPFVRFRIM